MTQKQTYTSDDSLIDDKRLLVGDDEVTFTVEVSQDTTEIYVCTTKDYAEALDKQKKGR